MQYCKGIIKKDRKTKKLINKLRKGDIALIAHKDIDELAANSLIESKVKCIINVKKTISGKYPNRGPELLVNNKIPIFETDEYVFNTVKDGDTVEIYDNKLFCKNKYISKCKLIRKEKIDELLDISSKNLEKELDLFIENTLEYAKKEKDLVLGKYFCPDIKTKITGKQVLVVARGKDYKIDLEAIKDYIEEESPVLIAVDGGGDALLKEGYIPDILIGDMDSVSNKCIILSKEVIVHAYTDGYAPGFSRVKNLNKKSKMFPCPGTSEDIALLLAYDKNPDLIVALGTHSNIIDFLEKGRKGMASTFLVRLKIGSKLIDAKGVNKLYKSRIKTKYIVGVGIASLVPIITLSFVSQSLKEIIVLIGIKLKIAIGF